eukprot:TRINITY_DN10782_c0_g1_i4.p1 TRINITY_DN10782_c0_g1~~TRINITY_DN10782_c0_g1_i4.p1  ORF type:complete len:344 (+),score=49.50 TRINITY_DN10782_c0_g1_i4:37-1032(+)
MAPQNYFKALAFFGFIVLVFLLVNSLQFVTNTKPLNGASHENASTIEEFYPFPPSVLPPAPPVTPDMMLPHNSPLCAFGPSQPFSPFPSQGHVCIVVRSYKRHITDPEYPLATFLHCFQQMEYQDWSMYIFNSDVDPAPGLLTIIHAQPHSIKKKIHWVEVPQDHLPKYKCWPGDCGYKPTDWVIWNACPRDARWLHVTNGDNEYHPKFFNFLAPDADLIGYDFFLWTNMFRIDNKVVHPDLLRDCLEEYRTQCLQTTMKVNGVDLASVVYSLGRFIKEGRNFSGLGKAAHDGVMVQAITNTWPTVVVKNCYISHNPNAWTRCRHNATKFA